VTSWNYAKPLGVPFFGKKTSFAETFTKAKRLALLKRRHRVWLRQQAAGEAPLEDESTGGDMIDMLFG
jgi:hypothetical protein